MKFFTCCQLKWQQLKACNLLKTWKVGSRNFTCCHIHIQIDFDVYFDPVLGLFSVCARLWQQMNLVADGLC